MSDDKTIVWALCHWNTKVCQAVSNSAVRAGKVRMALYFGAVVGEFKMPRSFTQKRFMNETGFYEFFEHAVDCHLVRRFISESGGNMFLRQRVA